MNDNHENRREEQLGTAEGEAAETEREDVAGAPAGPDGGGAAAESAGATASPGGGQSGVPPSELSRAELEGELAAARAEIGRLQDQSLRRQAELINYRRRAQKEIAESVALGQSRVLELIVPVVDDFERAVGTEAADARAYHEGMELILRRLHKVLELIGVQRIVPRGEPFDPRFHEAVARHQTDDVPDGHVLDVYQAGYRLRDRLIRPASVVVAYAGGSAAAADDTEAAGEAARAGGSGVADDG